MAPPNFTLPQTKYSALFQQPDGYWNFGEGFQVDVGGVLNNQIGTFNAATNIRVITPPPNTNGWRQFTDPFTNGQYYEFIGQLCENPITSQPPPTEQEASFRIVVKSLTFQGRPIVLLLPTEPSFIGSKPEYFPYSPHDYPGNFYPLGMWDQVWPRIEPMIDRVESIPSPAFTMVGATITPRTSYRPLTHKVQRLRQLRLAVIAKLQDLYGPGIDVATLVAGSSFGGLTTQAALWLHPTEFQAGLASAYNAGHRTLISDQNSYVMFASSLGVGPGGDGDDPRSISDWTIYAHQNATDFMSMSSLNRKRWGDLRRPLTVIVADEDTVSHGSDWVLPFQNAPNTPVLPLLPDHGSVDLGSGLTGKAHWVHIRRACHGGDNGFDNWSLPTVAGTYPTVNVGPHHTRAAGDTELVLFMLYEAHQQRSQQPSAPPSLRPRHSDFNSTAAMGPHDHAMNRMAGTRNGTNNNSLPLQEDSSWTRYGAGTWLGSYESLKVAKASSGDQLASVYTGSSDGVITRWKTKSVTVGSQTIRPFAQEAQSPSLGYGVYALDVAPGLVAAAAYRRVATYNPVSLNQTAILQLDSLAPNSDRAWEYSQPRQLQIAEVVASSAGPEILVATLGGHILVLSSGLSLLAESARSRDFGLCRRPTFSWPPLWPQPAHLRGDGPRPHRCPEYDRLPCHHSPGRCHRAAIWCDRRLGGLGRLHRGRLWQAATGHEVIAVLPRR